MTTEQIAIMANRGQIATADFNLIETLRFEVLPEFYALLPEATWRRKTASLPITQVSGKGPYDLPNDFYSMISISAPAYNMPAAQPHQWPTWRYIGEDPILIAQAEASTNTPAQQVAGYYIVPRASDGEFKSIKLDLPPNSNFSALIVYLAYPYFGTTANSANLNHWIPEPLQAALIHGLRSKIYFDRYGEGDPRGQQEQQTFMMLTERAASKHDLARRNYAIYVS